MAEDFDDFGDFTSAFPTSSGVNYANMAQTTTSSAINQANSADKVDFFTSFPPPISSTSGDAAPLDFASFDAFSNHTSEGIVDGGETTGFGQFDVANMDFTELKIPSPTDPNVHMAGGVAFDIPPILDDDFSNPSSPTPLPNQVQFQGDLFSADFTKSETNQEVKETPTDVHLSFPISGSQQSSHEEDKGDTKDDSFGEFESSLSLQTGVSGLKTAAELSSTEGGNLGLNSVSAADSSARDATNSGQVHALGGDLKSGDEFGDFTQSTSIEVSAFTNLGNSLDVTGFTNFESTANSKSESKQPDASKNLTVTANDPVPLGSDGFASFDHFQSSKATGMANQDNAQFGDFGVFSNSGATTAQGAALGAFQTQAGSTASAAQDDSTRGGDFGVFSTATDAQKDDRTATATTTAQDDTQFGNFGAFTTATDAQKDDSTATAQGNTQFGDFGAFSTATDVQKDDPTSTAQGDTQFGDFGAFSTATDVQKDDPTSTAQGDTQFGDFGAFSSSSTTNTKDGTKFGSFGAFQTPAADSTTTTKSDSQFGDFGAFSGSSSSNAKEDDFGNFGAFQTESTSTAVLSSTTSGQQGDGFGAFADSMGKDDDFGDFSTSDSGFGNFTSSETAPKPKSNNTPLKEIENVISDCFPGADSSQDNQIPHSTTPLSSQLFLSSKPPDSSENDPPFKMWTTLQKSIDFTVPLKKWDSSYMEDCYFMALKMDPKLVTKAGILPLFNNMGQFGAPLGGVTALDLLESFGFEGGLEAVTQEPSSPTAEFPFRSGSPGPALLDLSLPTSPKSPTNKNASFTLDADLLGLDLNPQSQSKPLTSIQELVLNERLVVNRSTWMDSELLELGGGGNSGNAGDGANTAAGGDTPSQTSSQPSTPRIGKKQNSIELQLLQLGLDASKTTFTSTSSHTELSLTARSTLGRLPDLSFMLQRDKIVRSTYQSGPSAS